MLELIIFDPKNKNWIDFLTFLAFFVIFDKNSKKIIQNTAVVLLNFQTVPRRAVTRRAAPRKPQAVLQL